MLASGLKVERARSQPELSSSHNFDLINFFPSGSRRKCLDSLAGETVITGSPGTESFWSGRLQLDLTAALYNTSLGQLPEAYSFEELAEYILLPRNAVLKLKPLDFLVSTGTGSKLVSERELTRTVMILID